MYLEARQVVWAASQAVFRGERLSGGPAWVNNDAYGWRAYAEQGSLGRYDCTENGPQDFALDAETQVIGRESVDSVVEQLSAREQRVFTEIYVLGYKMRAVSRRLDLPYYHVRTCALRLRKKLHRVSQDG